MQLDSILHARIGKQSKKLLAKQAKDFGVSFSAYVRLVLEQAARTPLKLKKGRMV